MRVFFSSKPDELVECFSGKTETVHLRAVTRDPAPDLIIDPVLENIAAAIRKWCTSLPQTTLVVEEVSKK